MHCGGYPSVGPLLFNFSDETGTWHARPQFMKVLTQKKSEKSDLEVLASLELMLKKSQT